MNLRVLCIDDSKSVHAFLKVCLSKVSRDVTSKYNGQEGIDTLLADQGKFDVVFLDWEMPVKTGPEVLIEARAKGVKIPIIMLTSKNEVSDISQMLQNGASEYIMKPFTEDLILQKLSELMPAGLGV
jgi:CheY-like chemotaxis protein